MRALVLLAALLFIVPTIVPAQTADKGKDSQQKKKKQIDTTNMIFDFKPPKGFDAGAQPEAGIIRWKKDGAEITLVVADLFAGPRDKLYRALLEAADGVTDGRLGQVQPVRGVGQAAGPFDFA